MAGGTSATSARTPATAVRLLEIDAPPFAASSWAPSPPELVRRQYREHRLRALLLARGRTRFSAVVLNGSCQVEVEVRSINHLHHSAMHRLLLLPLGLGLGLALTLQLKVIHLSLCAEGERLAGLRAKSRESRACARMLRMACVLTCASSSASRKMLLRLSVSYSPP